MNGASISRLTQSVEQELLPTLHIESTDPYHPVEVHHVPEPWQLLGAGNYAAVLTHPDYPEVVIKIYAPGRPGFDAEVEVYRRLGEHPAYSQCLHAGKNYLILRRLRGVTLYDCVHRGLLIPEQVIKDVDAALDYARSRGLQPHDVHGKNVMMQNGRGLVVDVSDFLEDEEDSKWRDLRKAYYRIYRPLFVRLKLRVPYFVLDGVRVGYRLLRRLKLTKRRDCVASS